MHERSGQPARSIAPGHEGAAAEQPPWLSLDHTFAGKYPGVIRALKSFYKPIKGDHPNAIGLGRFAGWVRLDRSAT